MSNIFPAQIRTVDPFANYNSNVVNVLTRMITNGTNCLLGNSSLDVTWDGTSRTILTVLPGNCFKDDVLIQVTNSFSVDLSDSSFYINPSDTFNQTGIYYVVLSYTYSKSRPAPQAAIQVLSPNEISSFNTTAYIFLKAITVSYSNPNMLISSISDFDSTNTINQRIYNSTFAGSCTTLPIWNSIFEGRIVYSRDTKRFSVGNNGAWSDLSSDVTPVDTSSCQVGDLCYLVNQSGNLKVLDAKSTTDGTSLADCVVIQNGWVQLVGNIHLARFEPGVTINKGDKLYLSKNVAGTFTNVSPGGSYYIQYIGKAITNIAVNGCIQIWLQPNTLTSISVANSTNSDELGGQPASFYQPIASAINNGNIASQHVSNSDNLGGNPPAFFQLLSTAINTDNIAEQSVTYAENAGTLDGNILSYFATAEALATTNSIATAADYTATSYVINENVIYVNSLIPYDNTIPQSTEGIQILQATITPKQLYSKLIIRVNISGIHTANGGLHILSLFSNTIGGGSNPDANAISVELAGTYSSGFTFNTQLQFIDINNGTLTPKTYYVRAGVADTSCAFYINGDINGSPLFGGRCVASITIEERESNDVGIPHY